MAGIISYGGYVPINRLSREAIAKAWGGGAVGGERSVANFDEDSLTMAVEAATDCLNGTDPTSVDSLYLATCNPPYQEKQCSSILGEALGLGEEAFTLDLTNSLRAASSAFRLALDSLNAGSTKKALVVASDCRVAAPNSEYEPIFGDGAAAFILGDSDVAVEVEDSYHISSAFMDVWRLPRERYHRTWEDRFILGEGYSRITRQAARAALKKFNLEIKDFNKVAYNAPDPRRHAEMARALGLDTKTQVQDPLFNSVGNTGAAFGPMILAAALEEAKPGDRILFLNYGDGCDVYSLKVTEQIERIRDRRGIKRHVASKLPIFSYEKLFVYRNMMEWEAERRTLPVSSLTVLWRERKDILGLVGHKCRVCGTIQYPAQRICTECQTKDQMDKIRLSDKKGKLFTFSKDDRSLVPELPNIICIINLEGGGRYYCTMTDRDPDKVEVGMEVELCFRNMHDGSGIHNYFWKCRPVRC